MRVISRAFRIFDARLDRSRIGRQWQREKWRIAYRFGLVHRVPRFEQLIAQPRRMVLIAAVVGFGDVQSVLEVGSGRGPNLYLLAKALPRANVQGVDISASAVEEAQRELAARGVSDVRLNVADVVDLSAFGGSSVDVVVADAVLFYVPPTLIRTALNEMLRVARRGLVLGTWDLRCSDGSDPWRYDEGTWLYDYRRLFAHRADLRVEALPVRDQTWTDERWRRHGSLLKVTLTEDQGGPPG